MDRAACPATYIYMYLLKTVRNENDQIEISCNYLIIPQWSKRIASKVASIYDGSQPVQ